MSEEVLADGKIGGYWSAPWTSGIRIEKPSSKPRRQVRSESRRVGLHSPLFCGFSYREQWHQKQHAARLEGRKLRELDKLERRVARVRKFIATGEMPHKRKPARPKKKAKPSIFDEGLRKLMGYSVRSRAKDLRRYLVFSGARDVLPLP